MTADAVGGVWTHVLELAAALSASGITVALATMGPRPSSRQRSAALAIPGLQLFESEFRLPWMNDPWPDVGAAGDWLLGIEARFGADIIHLSEPVFGALPWNSPVIAVAHSCVLSWWAAVHSEHAPPTWERYRLAMRDGLAAADAVVAPSRFMLGELDRHYGVRGGRVVYNGRDGTRFQVGKKVPFVLSAGRVWDPAKNMAALDEAAAERSLTVRVAGDARPPAGAPDFVPTRLRLEGVLDETQLATLMSRAAIFALPARYEPFGLAVLEAALSGCALVLSDIPSLRELWHGAAVFVAPDDAAWLRRALASLMESGPRRAALGESARRRASGLTPARMAAGYASVYAELLVAEAVPPVQEAATCAS